MKSLSKLVSLGLAYTKLPLQHLFALINIVLYMCFVEW